MWFQTGLAYRETTTSEYDAGARFGVMGTFPLGRIPGLYAAAAIDRWLVVDVGGWFTLPTGLDDPFGVQTYLGTGFTVVAGRVGIALSGAISYEFEPNLSVFLLYTHRPLLLPELSQAFDLSAGLKIDLR